MHPIRSPLHPDFTARIGLQLGDQAGAFLQSLETAPPVSIRRHPQKPAGLFADCEPVPWAEGGCYLEERPVFTLDPAFHGGAYYVQEASSMLLDHVVRSLFSSGSGEPVQTVLDACAAPGGKTTLLASALPESFIVANEVIRSRVPVLVENVTKWGTGNIAVTSVEVNTFAALPGFFDLVVADAPCSGEGLFRKQPDARSEWSPENAHHCSLRQRRILMDVWPSLRPGGHLIYSTCTLNPAENEQNLRWLVDETGAETVNITMPEHWGISTIETGGTTGYACYPHRVRGEGFFIAVVRKTVTDTDAAAGNPGPVKHTSFRSGAPHKTVPNKTTPYNTAPYETVPNETAAKLNDWFTGGGHQFIRYGKMIHRTGAHHLTRLHLLHGAMPVRYAGIETAEAIRDELKPAHAAALCPFLNAGHFQVMDLTRDEALTCLRSEPLPAPPSGGKGWVLARYNGLGLGWLKHAGNRMNNYYPRNWRIRMRS
jgi:16S rRNA C967 or C1407 C5-methylase (RsmB/RsmF family)/NOL1/NOP2/fmu family ribosome biogenesis protein